MKQGDFVFVSNKYFDKYDTEDLLMQNKGKKNKRPCLIAFVDKNDPRIYWCVPVSSKVDKYKDIYERLKKNPKYKCDTLTFGKLCDKRTTFLTQNMFPITRKYIDSVYIDARTGRVAQTDESTVQTVHDNGKRILREKIYNNRKLIFPDIMDLYREMNLELKLIDEKEQKREEKKLKKSSKKKSKNMER